MEAGKRMHSIETKEAAAAEFLNSIYMLDQRCRGVKYDIWDNGPNGWDEVHFVSSLKKQKWGTKVNLLNFFQWVWKDIWSNCLVFIPMSPRIHGLFQITYLRQYMQCCLESVCVYRGGSQVSSWGETEWTQQVTERSPNWVVQKAAVSDEDCFSSVPIKEHVKMETGKKTFFFANYSTARGIQPLNCVLRHLNNP